MILDLLIAQNSPSNKVRIPTLTIHYNGQKIGPLKKQTHPYLQVPTTQLAKMGIDPKFVELTADVLNFFFYKMYLLDD